MSVSPSQTEETINDESTINHIISIPSNSSECISSWTSHYDENHMKLNHSVIKLNDGVCLRTETFFPFPAKDLFHMMADSFGLLQDDPLIVKFKLLEEVSSEVMFYEIQTTHGVFLNDFFCLKRVT